MCGLRSEHGLQSLQTQSMAGNLWRFAMQRCLEVVDEVILHVFLQPVPGLHEPLM